jgi:hypothetical protein
MTPAQAQTPGGYAGIGVMAVSTDNARDFASIFIGSGGSADKSAGGLKLYGGYQWPNRFGIEAGLYNLGTYEVLASGTKSDEFEVSALAVSGTYAIPMGTSSDLTLKLGLAFTNVDYTCLSSCGGIFVNTSKSGVAGLLGGGVGWRITPKFSLRADLELFGGVNHSVGGLEAEYGYGALSLSGQVKF